MPELLDIRDKQGNLTGETMMRPEVHSTEAWHGVALVWLYNSNGDILLQRRAAHLNAFPEKWDVTMSGHLTAGDIPAQAAVRELSEELGLYVKAEELESAGMMADSFQLKSGKMHNECDYIFLLRQDIDIKSLKLQAAEVQDIRWISVHGLERDLSNLTTKQTYSRRNPQLYQLIIDTVRKQTAKPTGL